MNTVPETEENTIWTMEMAVAALISMPERYRRSGMMTVPPPIPIRPAKIPPATPISKNVIYSNILPEKTNY